MYDRYFGCFILGLMFICLTMHCAPHIGADARHKTINSACSACIKAWLGLRKRREYFQISVWREAPGAQNDRLAD
jgi:hypothetical protein